MDMKRIAEAGFDYLALGHIHKPQAVIRGKALYPGALEPIDRNDTGKHGYIQGCFDQGRIRLKFIPFARREYQNLLLTMEAETTQYKLEEMLKNQVMERGYQNIYRLILQGWRSPELILLTERLKKLGNIVEVLDESRPVSYTHLLKDMLGDAAADLTMQDLALIGQYSENNFNGMNCGIMDQFASAMGKKDCAIFLDTSTLEFEYAPVVLKDARIVITNSKVKHSLVGSAYNDRRNECEQALQDLKKVVDIKTLGDLTEEEFEAHKDAITSDICRKRAKHAVYENQRTIKAVAALKADNVEEFGRLMNASHVSLRDDYEVSCEEIDILVDLAWEIPGVIGSRITGGGFGGCTVSIVKNDAVDTFIETLGKQYQEKTGHEAEFYVVDIGDGAHVIA